MNNFKKYEKVRLSGKYNMITEWHDAALEANLTRDEYFSIIKNYEKYKEANDMLYKNFKVNDNITHQNIGGKIITLENFMEFQDAPFNIAFSNFVARMTDIPELDEIIFYGHVGNLGYFVRKSEVKEID